MDNDKYVVFLRGINVGGHHKVPMKDLKKELENMGYKNVITLLNSGNVIFNAKKTTEVELESKLTTSLEKKFGFPIPVIVRNAEDITHISNLAPFKNIEVTKNTRLYISFLKQEPKANLELPWKTEDGSYQILDVYNKTIFSVLDLSVSKTTKGMDMLEKLFGKDITTRNWNTIEKISNKL